MDKSNTEKSEKKFVAGDENISSVVSQLIKMVLAMPIEEQRRLLGELKAREGKANRADFRKSYFTSVQFTVAGLLYSGFITDISSTGVFIEAPKTDLNRLRPDEAAILIFQHPETKRNIKLTAKIVRIDENGIGVRFNQVQENLVR